LECVCNFKMKKKSQAALEFLTTYAWAFILILIVIAAISYFGVLRPKQILPDRCIFTVSFGCQAYKIDDAGTFDLQLKNQIGQTVDVTGIDIKREDEVLITCTTPPALPTNWKIGQVQDLRWSGCDAGFSDAGLVQGDKGKLLINMSFFPKPGGSIYSQSAEGEVLATVQ
jgi:hypothetical protein